MMVFARNVRLSSQLPLNAFTTCRPLRFCHAVQGGAAALADLLKVEIRRQVTALQVTAAEKPQRK